MLVCRRSNRCTLKLRTRRQTLQERVKTCVIELSLVKCRLIQSKFQQAYLGIYQFVIKKSHKQRLFRMLISHIALMTLKILIESLNSILKQNKIPLEQHYTINFRFKGKILLLNNNSRSCRNYQRDHCTNSSKVGKKA